MVQLLEGSEAGFDPLYYQEIVDCMISYDVDLVTVQACKHFSTLL